jgi:protocatechuate 3,4-dioxygenase beta subunit
MSILLALTAIACAEPVTIFVEDAISHEPIEQFEYFTIVETADGTTEGEWHDWVAFDRPDGTITLNLPVACKLKLGVRARAYVYDYPGTADYIIIADPASRKIEHGLQPGITVKGRVVDSETGEPIVGASVSPLKFTPPSWSPDRERKVLSDADGNFELPGVNHSGFVAESPAYQQRKYMTWDDKPGDTIVQDIHLNQKDLFSGVVRDEQGNPVQGAVVKDGAGKEVTTDEHGQFDQLSATYWNGQRGSFYVEVSAPGFLQYRKTVVDLPKDGFVITLDREFVIRGTVVDPDGKPVPFFDVWAGPGLAPSLWQCEATNVQNSSDGTFSLGIEYDPAKNWVGVHAPGFAPFETWIPMNRDDDSLVIELNPGVRIAGTVVRNDEHIVDGVAHLLFDRQTQRRWFSNSESAAGQFFSRDVPINQDGSFEFLHIRPGQYVLHLGGSNFSGQWLLIGVRDGGGTAIGEVPVDGVGTVTGTAFGFNDKPWAFNDGELIHPAIWSQDGRYRGLRGGAIQFRTDEHGRFRIEGVPVGEASVEFEIHLSADMLSSVGDRVTVKAGKTVEIAIRANRKKVLNDQAEGGAVTAVIQVGDGSEQDWLAGTARSAKRKIGHTRQYGPRQGESITSAPPRFSMWLESIETGTRRGNAADFTTNGSLTTNGVQPGRYRLLVRDTLSPGRYSIFEPIFETEIDVAGPETKIDVQLGAGTLTGRAILPTLEPLDPNWAIARAYLVGPNGRTHQAVADELGGFVFRYLQPGRYECFVRHEHLGWSRFEPILVSNHALDLGEVELKQGATVEGTIKIETICPIPTALQAVSPEGIEFEPISYEHNLSSYIPSEFTIRGLWPGLWKLNLMQNQTVLSTTSVHVPDDGKVSAEIIVP